MPDFGAGDPCEISFDHTKGDREELCPNGCGERLRIYSSHAWEVDNPGEWHSHERCISRLKAALSVVRTIYKRLVERGGDSLTYGEWAQVGDAVDPILGRKVSSTETKSGAK